MEQGRQSPGPGGGAAWWMHWALHTEILHREIWPRQVEPQRGLGSGQAVPVLVCLELKRPEDSVVNCQSSVAYVFDCAASSLPCGLLASCRERGLLSSCGVWASCGAASLAVEQSPQVCGLQ